MKEGWTYKKLGDCFVSINNGANIKQIKGASGIPITRIETLSNDKFNRDRMGYANIEDITPYSSYILNEGDILMSHINSMKFLGRAVEYSKKGNEQIIHGMNLLKLVPTKDIISSFMIYQFQTPFFRNQIATISHQSVNQASFNTTNLKGLNLIVPSLSEQQRIVSRLDAAFAHIDELKSNAEKQLSEARVLFQKALTKAMEPKEGWEENTLKDVSTIAGDYGLSVSSKPFDGVRYLRITDITDWGDLNDDMVSANVDSDKKQEELEEGDILFARTGATVGKTLVYKKEFGECMFAGYLIRYRLNKDIILPRYMYYVTHSKDYYDWVFVNQEAAAQPNISAKKYNLLPVYYPSISEQQRIVSRLDAISAHIRELEEVLQKTIAECDALKQALLRKVFE